MVQAPIKVDDLVACVTSASVWIGIHLGGAHLRKYCLCVRAHFTGRWQIILRYYEVESPGFFQISLCLIYPGLMSCELSSDRIVVTR